MNKTGCFRIAADYCAVRVHLSRTSVSKNKESQIHRRFSNSPRTRLHRAKIIAARSARFFLSAGRTDKRSYCTHVSTRAWRWLFQIRKAEWLVLGCRREPIIPIPFAFKISYFVKPRRVRLGPVTSRTNILPLKRGEKISPTKYTDFSSKHPKKFPFRGRLLISAGCYVCLPFIIPRLKSYTTSCV